MYSCVHLANRVMPLAVACEMRIPGLALGLPTSLPSLSALPNPLSTVAYP